MTNKADPATVEEYNAKSHAGIRYFGHGIRETGMSIPCPFCAAPDFVEYKLIEMEAVMSKEIVCKACGRGMRTIFERSRDGVKMEMVQSRGDQPPAYLPKMRAIADVKKNPNLIDGLKYWLKPEIANSMKLERSLLGDIAMAAAWIESCPIPDQFLDAVRKRAAELCPQAGVKP